MDIKHVVTATISIKLPLQLTYVIYLFVSVALMSCPILDKDNVIKTFYITLSCLNK